MSKSQQQCASAVLMVRPAAFGYNPQTAESNRFQRPGEVDQAQALSEFDRFVQALGTEAIAVCAVDDTAQPVKPDAVFPNNWGSFHEDGTLVLYPLQSVSRRFERRPEVIERAVRELGFKVSHLLDLTWYEGENKFLEGTGSLVLDHIARAAYACLSPRTHPEVVAEWAQILGYEPVTFSAAREMVYDPTMANDRERVATRSIKEPAKASAFGLASTDDQFDVKSLPRRRMEDEDKGLIYGPSSAEFLKALNRGGAQWLSADCHRSQYGYPFRVGINMALENRHRAVTLVSVACSGAQVSNLFVDHEARERNSEPGGAMVPPQPNSPSSVCGASTSTDWKASIMRVQSCRPGSRPVAPRPLSPRHGTAGRQVSPAQ